MDNTSLFLLAFRTLPVLSALSCSFFALETLSVPRRIPASELFSEIDQNAWSNSVMHSNLNQGRGAGGNNTPFFSMSRKPVLAFNFGPTAHDLSFTFEREKREPCV